MILSRVSVQQTGVPVQLCPWGSRVMLRVALAAPVPIAVVKSAAAVVAAIFASLYKGSSWVIPSITLRSTKYLRRPLNSSTWLILIEISGT